MAFGIHSNSGSTSARPAPRAVALGALVGRAWRQLRWWIVRRRRDHALADLNDELLRDMGVIRERDIGLSRDAAARQAERLLWRL